MKRIFAIVILLCIAYFVGGYVAVQFGLIAQELYLSYAGFVGGIASVAGLFSFIKPALTNDDLQELESGSLKSLAETTEQLKTLESQRSQAKSDIGDLEVRKKEMELLVKKASTSLFLKEQYSQHVQKILSRIKNDEVLTDSLLEITEIRDKLTALEEEIEADPNVETLRDVIKSANRHQNDLEDAIDEAIEQMPSILRPIIILLRALGKALTATVVTINKT
jgi:chromosome segregation ATPase